MDQVEIERTTSVNKNLDKEAFEAAWDAYRNTPIDASADTDDEVCRCLYNGIEAYLTRRQRLDWDAPHNRSYDPVEERAAEIYGLYRYDGPGEKPRWVPHGNSNMQDRARGEARLELRLKGHVPQ